MQLRVPMNLVVIASAWIMFASVVSAAQAGGSERQFSEQLTHNIAKVRTGNSAVERTDAAERLAELTRRGDSKKLDDKTLADLVSLLNTSDESVLYWVARCLGKFGTACQDGNPETSKEIGGSGLHRRKHNFGVRYSVRSRSTRCSSRSTEMRTLTETSVAFTITLETRAGGF